MLRLSCRYNQSRMPAFVSGDLPVETRRFIARHIENCPTCRAEYERQRNAARNFTREIPVFATPGAAQLDAVWAGITQELQDDKADTIQKVPVVMSPKMRHGLAVAVFVVAMMIFPVALKHGVEMQPGVPSQPVPQLLTETPTQTETATSISVATAIAQAQQTEAVASVSRGTPQLLKNTPVTPEPTR